EWFVRRLVPPNALNKWVGTVFYDAMYEFFSLHHHLHRVGVQHHAADDLARAGAYADLFARFAVFQRLPFTRDDETHTARLRAHHLTTLDGQRAAQRPRFNGRPGRDALCDNLINDVAGVDGDTARQGKNVPLAGNQVVKRDRFARLQGAIGYIEETMN